VVSAANINICDGLPPGNYIVQFDQQSGEYFLETVDNFTIPTKLYGNVFDQAERIISTFMDRPNTTGVLLTGEKGSGKALRVDQSVYTPMGERKIGELVVGDMIYGADGKLTTVLGVYPQGVRDMFEVTFNDGSQVIADGEHLWDVKQTTRSQVGFPKQSTKNRIKSTIPKILTTAQIKQALNAGVKHVVPLCGPVEFPKSDVDADRYTIGLLIGDGCLCNPTLTISSNDPAIVEHLQIDNIIKYTSGVDYRFVDCKHLVDQLTLLGLRGTRSNTKFIPEKLKYDSVENRFALLQGLMDSDGTVSKRGGITYTTVSNILANDMVWLARSLGFRSSIQHTRAPSYTHNGIKKIGQLAYTVQLTGEHTDKVFRLERKQARVKPCSSNTKTIVDIKSVAPDEAVCILVDNESHLFVTNDFTVTHNTMLTKVISTTLAAKGISTVVINECMYGDLFNKFIQMIDSECVVLFDEFEKVYPTDVQEKMLTLLDGVFPSKKLFLFTSNSSSRINSHLMNRPGRIFYVLKYAGLDSEYITQYCNDVLVDKSYIDEICRLSLLFSAFNFDMLKALVEDMNRYNESPTQVMKLLNAIPEDTGNNSFDVELSYKGEWFNKGQLDDHGAWSGNPLDPRGVGIEYRNPNPNEDNDSNYWLTVLLFSENLTRVDIETGTFEYAKDDFVLRLKRSKTLSYQYSAF
jgi:hypothetical protein